MGTRNGVALVGAGTSADGVDQASRGGVDQVNSGGGVDQVNSVGGVGASSSQVSNTGNDVEEAEKAVDAYKEIANLRGINHFYPLHKSALEEW